MNEQLFQAVNQMVGVWPWLDRLMIFIANDSPVLFALVLLMMWFRGRDQALEANRQTALLAVFSTVAGLLINAVIHAFYFHPRPFVEHHIHQLIAHANDSGFVSDHGTMAFGIALVLVFRKHAWRSWVFVLAVLTAFSRVYVGVHYPFDVIGAGVLTLITGLFVVLFAKLFDPLNRLILAVYRKVPLLSNFK